jgi:hypothetical protein
MTTVVLEKPNHLIMFLMGQLTAASNVPGPIQSSNVLSLPASLSRIVRNSLKLLIVVSTVLLQDTRQRTASPNIRARLVRRGIILFFIRNRQVAPVRLQTEF